MLEATGLWEGWKKPSCARTHVNEGSACGSWKTEETRRRRRIHHACPLSDTLGRRSGLVPVPQAALLPSPRSFLKNSGEGHGTADLSFERRQGDYGLLNRFLGNKKVRASGGLRGVLKCPRLLSSPEIRPNLRRVPTEQHGSQKNPKAIREGPLETRPKGPTEAGRESTQPVPFSST